MYCKNCKYFEPVPNTELVHGLCKHPNAIKHLVLHTGKNVYERAVDMRKKGAKLCGHDAKFYIDKKSIQAPEKDMHVYCSTCKFCKLNDTWYGYEKQLEYAFCTAKTKVYDVVTGEPVYNWTKNMRMDQNYTIDELYLCGSQGLFYEESLHPIKHDTYVSFEDIKDSFDYANRLLRFIVYMSILLFILILKA